MPSRSFNRCSPHERDGLFKWKPDSPCKSLSINIFLFKSMTILALYLALCFQVGPHFRNAPPVLRDAAPLIRRAMPTEMPTIDRYPAAGRMET